MQYAHHYYNDTCCPLLNELKIWGIQFTAHLVLLLKITIYRLHRMHAVHEMQPTVIDVHSVCPPVTWLISASLWKTTLLYLLVCCCCFLAPELVDQDWPDGRPSFLCHRWGSCLNSIKIHRNLPYTSLILFYGWQKVPNFDPDFHTSRLRSELEDFFGNLKNLSTTDSGHTS